MQRRLGQQDQRVGLLLRPRRRLQGGVGGQGRRLAATRPLIQGLARGVERPNQERPRLRRQPPANHHRAVLVLDDVQRPPGVLPGRLAGLGQPIDPAPSADDPLHVRGRARASHRQQPGFRLRRRHARERADLGIGQLPPGEDLGQPRQRLERMRDPDSFPGRAQVEPDPPVQPMRTGLKADVPPSTGVEVPELREQPGGGRVEMGGQLGDLVAEAVEIGDAR